VPELRGSRRERVEVEMDQKDVFVGLGVGAARDTAGRSGFAVDLHEGGHWMQLAVLPTKDEAKAAIARAVSEGVSEAHLRVRKVHVERGAEDDR
jgi:hypothetical protein